MKQRQQGFSILELVIVLLCISLLVITGLYIWHHTHPSSSNGSATKKSLVTLKDSGSTNFTGWSITIYSDGSAGLDCDSGPQPNKSCTSTSYKPNTFPAGKLSSDLAKTNLDSDYNCIRSVSTGSTETLVYKSKSITGIDCYFSANPTSSLSKDILPYLQKSNLN